MDWLTHGIMMVADILASNRCQAISNHCGDSIATMYEQLEMHGCILSTAAADVLVLKHQTISIHSAD